MPAIDGTHAGSRHGRLTIRQLIALDALAGAGYLLAGLPTALVRAEAPAWATVGVMTMVGAPLAARRRWPTVVFVVVLTASVAAAAIGILPDPFLSASFALYPVALRARRDPLPPAVPGAAAGVVLGGGGIVGPAASLPAAASQALLGAAFIAAAWTAGRLVAQRRADAARAAAQFAGRVAAEERLRIARELHDLLAHSMSLIAVQAGTANHVLAIRPEMARDALAAIESTSRRALAEVRHLVGVLRTTGDDTELAPLPGLADLSPLVDATRAAGIDVELSLKGIEHVPPTVALTVYRIVQEALTNVVRHAPGSRCQVSVTATFTKVDIDVMDDGTAPRPSRPGHGLIGMHERVSMHGGRLVAGPREQGGWHVQARIPYES